MTFILIYRLSPFSEWRLRAVERLGEADVFLKLVLSLGGQACLSGHGRGLRT